MLLKNKSIRKILIITLSNFGDVILTMPVIASVRKAFPQAEIHVAAGEKVQELLQGNAVLKKVFLYSRNLSLRQKIQYVRTLRTEKYDFVIDFRNSLIPYLLGKPSKSMWLNREARKIESRYERYNHVIDLLGLPHVDAAVLPLYTKADNDSLMRRLHSKGLFSVQNILLVSPGARLKLKRWPSDYFAELIKGVLDREEMTVILVGDAYDRDAAQEVEALLDEREVINICGRITQKELAALIERARLVLSNDSAITHFANYYDRSVVTLFGPTSAHKYGHRKATSRIAQLELACIPCEGSKCQKGRRCLDELTPKEVLGLALELLERRS